VDKSNVILSSAKDLARTLHQPKSAATNAHFSGPQWLRLRILASSRRRWQFVVIGGAGYEQGPSLCSG
jgi:hypothetical protein